MRSVASRGLWALVLVVGCKHAPLLPVKVAPPAGAAVVVTALDVRLPTPEQGRLELTVEAPTWPVALVSWELWLGGVVVASGVTGEVEREAAGQGRVRVRLTEPFDVRGFPWRAGERQTEVRVRGRLLATADEGAAYLEWAAHRSVVVAGLPDPTLSVE